MPVSIFDAIFNASSQYTVNPHTVWLFNTTQVGFNYASWHCDTPMLNASTQYTVNFDFSTSSTVILNDKVVRCAFSLLPLNFLRQQSCVII